MYTHKTSKNCKYNAGANELIELKKAPWESSIWIYGLASLAKWLLANHSPARELTPKKSGRITEQKTP